jgi:hypothetical protein
MHMYLAGTEQLTNILGTDHDIEVLGDIIASVKANLHKPSSRVRGVRLEYDCSHWFET